MKNFILAFFTFAFLGCQPNQKKVFNQAELSQKVLDSKQKSVSFATLLNNHKGKTVVVAVWASWCSDCIKAMPKMKTIQRQHSEVDFVFISYDKSFEKWQKGIAKHQLSGNQYWVNDTMDGSFGNALEINWIPRYIIVGKNGQPLLYNATEADFETIASLLKNEKNK